METKCQNHKNLIDKLLEQKSELTREVIEAKNCRKKGKNWCRVSN